MASSAKEREEEVFDLLDAKNKDALASRIKTIDSLRIERYDRVYIIGHSLGMADYSVFDAINKDAEIVCFYYSETEKDGMEKTLQSLGMRYVMKQNSVIYALPHTVLGYRCTHSSPTPLLKTSSTILPPCRKLFLNNKHSAMALCS